MTRRDAVTARKGDYLHKRMIRLRCERCKKSRLVLRKDDIDPPTAATCVMICPDCEGTGEFESIAYLDTNGAEVSGDPETWKPATPTNPARRKRRRKR